MAARANTTFLRLLAAEIPCAFIAQDVNSVSLWYHWLSSIGVKYVSEVDCKDQFNNIDPNDSQSHLSSASSWLSSRKRWHMHEIMWSVHKESKRLDRARRGNSTKFWYVTHEAMTDTIMFEMHHNNYIKAAGGLWRRDECIPMGGSFFAQAADLHSLWGVYTGRHKFSDLGDLHISDEGFPYLVSQRGNIALCQFRDNIPIATSFLDSPQARVVDRVCKILESCWDLAVLCSCRQQQTDPYKFSCHTHTCVALGYCLVRGEQGCGTVFIQPSALDQNWCLKLVPPLITPSDTHPAYLPGIILCALSNARQWCRSWAGELLSLAAWL